MKYKYTHTKNRAEFASEHNISTRLVNKYGLKFLKNNPEVLEAVKLISQLTGIGEKIPVEIKESRKQANKVKGKITTDAWRKKNKEKLKEKDKEYREKNKEKIALYQKQYKEKNREKILIKKREYAKRKYYEHREVEKLTT